VCILQLSTFKGVNSLDLLEKEKRMTCKKLKATNVHVVNEHTYWLVD